MVDKCVDMVYYSQEQAGRWNSYPKYSDKANDVVLKLKKSEFKKNLNSNLYIIPIKV